MFPREIHDHGDLGFRDFVSKYAALPDTMLMHMHHDAARFIGILVEKSHQDVGDEFHRRVIIVQQENAIHARLLRLGFGAGDHSRPGTIVPGLALAGFARGAKRRQEHPAPAYPDPNRKLADRHYFRPQPRPTSHVGRHTQMVRGQPYPGPAGFGRDRP